MRILLKKLLYIFVFIIVLFSALAIYLWPYDPYLQTSSPINRSKLAIQKSAQNPLITSSMSPRLSKLADQQGSSNINGPSVIRVPEWVSKPLGRYYLYFAHHKGDFIRLAYADDPTGPWTIYEPGALSLADSGFPVNNVPLESVKSGLRELWENFSVFLIRDYLRLVYKSLVTDQKKRQIRGIDSAKYKVPHIASPEVVIDDVNQHIVMFYHGQRDSLAQVTRVAISTDGIEFVEQQIEIPGSYVRSFKYQDQYYLLGALGMLLRSDSLLGPYQIRRQPLFDVNIRHPAVWVETHRDLLHVFWTRVGDAPEHILQSQVSMLGAWHEWQATEGVSLVFPELPWEGGNLSIRSSLRGEISFPVRELRDPFLFVDDDNLKYLFYSGAGEQSIGVALVVNPE
jgi:hypothetical protein